MNIRTCLSTPTEIKNAIKKAQQWEGSRLDNIPPEAIKAAGEVSEEVLLDFYNRMLDEERVPEKREKGLLIKLPKYGDVSNCRNCCGIILLTNVLYTLSSPERNLAKTALERNSQGKRKRERSRHTRRHNRGERTYMT